VTDPSACSRDISTFDESTATDSITLILTKPYADALAQQVGGTSFFVTITCNGTTPIDHQPETIVCEQAM
jgi:hypothetical protein